MLLYPAVVSSVNPAVLPCVSRGVGLIGEDLRPRCTVRVLIEGEPEVGNTLLVGYGTWEDADTFDRQWYQNGVLIPGATDDELLLTEDFDAGSSFRFRETATNAYGSRTVWSNTLTIPPSEDSFLVDGEGELLLTGEGGAVLV